MRKRLLRGGHVVSDEGTVRRDVLIGISGEIEEVAEKIQDHKDADVTDCDGKLLFPLLIDCHVHFREPGLTHKGTMESESLAALAGGVGTACEMPNTIPPTVTVEAFADKVKRAEAVDRMDLRFFFGATEAAHLESLRTLWKAESLELKKLKRHCSGLKLYLDHSTGNQKVDGGIVEEIFRTCAELKIPLVAHCEDADMNAEFAKKYPVTGSIETHSMRRPPESEALSVKDAIAMAKKTGAALHVAHLSTKGALEHVRAAKKAGLPVTCEATPHHLFFSTDDYAALGTLGKMNPPLRSPEDRDALWGGITDGTVDCVSTDHAPHTLEEKRTGNPLEAPSGVPGVETMFPLLLDGAAKKKITEADILRVCFTNPNRIFSLGLQGIVKGAPARIAVIDPKAEWTLSGSALHQHCGWTPYEGRKVTGQVTEVIAR